MIRKKMPSKEETPEERDNETSDNKESNNIQEPSVERSEETGSGTVTGEKINESPAKESAPADKVVPPEKTFEEKLAEMQDKYIRLSAEFDNYRKRTLREKMDLSKYASENLLLQILPFMDDFERALKNIEIAKDPDAVKEGIALIHTKLTEFFNRSGVSEIEALNCPFNIDLHDAVAKIAAEEDKKGKVVDVVQKGYYLLDKVIRHSKVVVGE